jgi:prepilin-type N-terminal cleavage/methylation domain-containing protein
MKLRTGNRGFTIVELLIVVVVIAILAAISIVAYNGIQERAVNSTVEADIAGTVKKIEMHRIDNNGVYATSSFPAATQIGLSRDAYLTGRNNFYYCASATGDRYALSAITRYGKRYVYSSTSGLSTATSNVDGGTNCTAAGNSTPPTPSTAWFQAYNWNTSTSTGSWSSWVK